MAPRRSTNVEPTKILFSGDGPALTPHSGLMAQVSNCGGQATKGHHDQRLQCFRKRSWVVPAARHPPMGDGSHLYFVRHTEIHARVRTRHCTIHFQQSVRFVAVYLRDQRRGLSAWHHRVNDSRSSRRRRIYPDPIGTRFIDGNWFVCNYVVVFLLDTRCRQMERIHGPNRVEPHRGILVQRCCPSLCLYRVVFGITAKESRPASVELMSRTRRVSDVSYGSVSSTGRRNTTRRSSPAWG